MLTSNFSKSAKYLSWPIARLAPVLAMDAEVVVDVCSEATAGSGDSSVADVSDDRSSVAVFCGELLCSAVVSSTEIDSSASCDSLSVVGTILYLKDGITSGTEKTKINQI